MSKYSIFGVIVGLCSLYPAHIHAYVPILVSQETPNDITTIDDPELSQAFYGRLQNFPHTYEIRSEKPFTLFVHIRLPDIDSSTNNVSAIIIKETRKGGRVAEVARLEAKNEEWYTSYDTRTGDRYREGSTFQKDLDAGVYRIEMHTPNNLEKYVFVVGTRDEMSIGYLSLIGRLVKIKLFFEKHPLLIIESRYVYVPLISICVLVGGGWLIYRRRKIYGM